MRSNLSSLLLIFLFLSNLKAFAQKEYNIWYFGTNAGVDFNSGSPVTITNSAMATFEGTVSISDGNGSLLFYSDGRTIWNRDHLPMPNGTGLLGHESACQSVLAVPKPGSSTIYYIFTVDAIENNLQNGLRYSILDMSLSGGLGNLTTKNVLLETPVTERLTAVRHSNGTDYWIITHKWNSNGFSAYLLSSTGLAATPIVSNVGSVHNGNIGNAIGQLKSNKLGTKLALAIRDVGKFELFDFNATTGVVSNAVSSSASYSVAVGVEFSADGSKLYGAAAFQNAIYQFNLASASPFASGIQIGSGINIPTAMQIGPDNKIYCTERDGFYLGMINNPNTLGTACNYVKNGIHLGGKKVWFGLPNIIEGNPEPKVHLGQDTTLCYGQTLLLGENPVTGNSYLWQDGSTQSTYLVTKPGKYALHIKNKELLMQDEIIVSFKDCSFLIPNIITPNQDGFNDNFGLKGVNANAYELQIFNRWGAQVYQTKSYQNDWDAKDNSAGMYYYLLKNAETGVTYKGWLEVVK
jgi:gliding motility-associated-like protein